MSGYVYRNRSTGQQVTLAARSARFDALTGNWELLEGEDDKAEPKAKADAEPAEQDQAADHDEAKPKPAAKPRARRRPSKEA